MNEWAIETKALTKYFDGDLAVNNLDLTVPEGSVFGLMGPNGAGKSTFIRMLMGIIIPDSGVGKVMGIDIADPTGQVRQQIGYVADIQNMYPFFRVDEILKFCAGIYKSWDEKRCQALLKAFELPTRKWVQSISKGMKTQLALIIALSIRPRILVLDEPTSGLDPVIKNEFMQLIMQEAASGDTTVFFSTHNVTDLERMADQVAVLMKGKLLFNRSMDELKTTARKIQVVFSNGFPTDINIMPQIIHVENEGKVSTVTVSENYAEVLERLKCYSPTYIETIDIGLEELFIHTLGKEGYGHEAVIL